MNDPYQTLGVSRNASKDEIKKAYKKLAMKHHPDKGGDATKFKDITNAYTELTEDKQPETMFSHGDFMGSSFFSTFFGGAGMGGGHGQASPAKKKIRKVIGISMKDAYKGTTKNVRIETDDTCDDCVKTCSECHGKGMVMVQRKTQVGIHIMIQSSTVPCTKCNGTGNMSGKNPSCGKCKGTSKVTHQKIVTLNIEPGCPTSKKFVFDSIIPKHVIEFVIQVYDMPNYKVNNNNLVYVHKIKLTDALCGTTVVIEHPSGEPVMIDTKTLPNIIYEGYELHIPNKGMTKNHGMNVIFKIINPKSKTEISQDSDISKSLRESLDKYLTY
jgi:DnaJ family protein A protein 2